MIYLKSLIAMLTVSLELCDLSHEAKTVTGLAAPYNQD